MNLLFKDRYLNTNTRSLFLESYKQGIKKSVKQLFELKFLARSLIFTGRQICSNVVVSETVDPANPKPLEWLPFTRYQKPKFDSLASVVELEWVDDAFEKNIV